MKTLFEVLKGIFLVFTVFLGIFFLRGELIFSTGIFNVIKQFTVPGYLVLSGLMIFYIVTLVKEKHTDLDLDKLYAKHFIIGILIGIVLAAIYIFIS